MKIKKYFLIAAIGLSTITGIFILYKEKFVGKKISSVLGKSEPVDEFTRIANLKSARVYELGETLVYNAKVRGTIDRALSWEDFPGLASEVAKFYPDGKQLLQIDYGEPGILVTRKTEFSTTGWFSLSVQKLMKWETTKGKVWVLVDYPEGYAEDKELKVLRGDLKELTFQYLAQKIPEQIDQVRNTKEKPKTIISEASLASLQFVHELGRRTGESSNFHIYTFANNLSLCSIKKEYNFNSESWKAEFENIFSEDEKNISHRIASCANGGPFTSGERVITFDECMCGKGGSDTFIAVDSSALKKFTKIINSTQGNLKDSERSIASEKNINLDKDCSSFKNLPEGAEHEVVEVCKKACESKFGYGCFKVGLDLEKKDKASSIEHYKKGCELKHTPACSFLVQHHPEIIPVLKIECDKNSQARSCALVASSFDKGRDRALESSGDMLKYGKKACDLGDGLGCLMAGLSFVSLMNPDDQASIQKYGKLGLPYVTKACEMGWEMGCSLMK